jgi:predicted transcriptional regulator
MTQATLSGPDAPMVLRACTASDLMAPNPISLRAEAGVAEAILLFTEKAIAAAPVIDESGRPIGVVSRSDLMIYQCEHEKRQGGPNDLPLAFESGATYHQSAKKMTIAHLMTPAVFAVAPDTPIRRVVKDMVGLHVHRLFVVDEAGVLVGVITTMDVLKHLIAEI